MSNLTLTLIATALCFACGAMASYSVLTMDLAGIPFVLASVVGVACPPLGCFMCYMAVQESKPKS